ncbi:dTDP-4-dehydrorhamnose 3,5-epimerase [Leeuwenhoekiella blandensis]|uniref:dTDP-4-dehydrorhamnose 3,5-epimerase n=1 Tax=Leeuwenhoekiella blandensis (strain CECT 7118 / CCUG 51940 / KCTC 22103 / MED217) TaxID=398720 RepID=A3XR69_LEEBM|nr:dTDP-4-dehydrorhamnose 3,5-epimerase [Leeuwenhoekiella blandensis]EAQ47948.1 dTDP-4-dehydrorhamnose 3,5-epimerase [Leeuwenhoekiella blandensis MED217]
MQAQETALKGCFILEPRVFKDDRGYFFESFNQKTFEELVGQPVHFVQDNQSFSQYGVIRGIHFQKGAHAQAKLVRVLEGEVLDVAVDLREGSPTYGQHVAVKLNAENNRQLFVPRGFGHGFSVLSETAVFAYKCDNYYHKASEGGIVYNDPTLAIDWGIPEEKIQVSEKDLVLEHFKN